MLAGLEAEIMYMGCPIIPPPPPQAQFPRQQRKSVHPSLAPGAKAGTEVVSISVGSVGHPHECALPCKYNSKARGCKDGANCVRCHICPWRGNSKYQKSRLVAASPESNDQEDAESTHSTTAPPSLNDETDLSTASPVARVNQASPVSQFASLSMCQEFNGATSYLASPMKIGQEAAPQDWSMGSLGHPHRCGVACKYKNRKGGCRNGRQCSSCHICQWSRKDAAKKLQELEINAIADNLDLGATLMMACNASLQEQPEYFQRQWQNSLFPSGSELPVTGSQEASFRGSAGRSPFPYGSHLSF
mmetsp:Transcript_64079/g.152821  ORF Transcript_64079/g.152821 Transcript_64079/m.152821 type:complete len:303 (+) Transcript_64079:173-1081(+)